MKHRPTLSRLLVVKITIIDSYSRKDTNNSGSLTTVSRGFFDVIIHYCVIYSHLGFQKIHGTRVADLVLPDGVVYECRVVQACIHHNSRPLFSCRILTQAWMHDLNFGVYLTISEASLISCVRCHITVFTFVRGVCPNKHSSATFVRCVTCVHILGGVANSVIE